MGVYGNILKDQSIDESVLFISNEAKQLKQELKDKFKSEFTKGVINRLKQGMKSTSDYDKNKSKSASDFVKSKLEDCIVYSVYIYQVINDGVATDYYRQNFYGFYKNSLIQIVLDYSIPGVQMVKFDELPLSKCIIPKEVISILLKKVHGRRYNPIVSKNKIKFESLGRDEKIKDILGDTIEQINSKYTNLNASFGKLFTTVVFKKK